MHSGPDPLCAQVLSPMRDSTVLSRCQPETSLHRGCPRGGGRGLRRPARSSLELYMAPWDEGHASADQRQIPSHCPPTSLHHWCLLPAPARWWPQRPSTAPSGGTHGWACASGGQTSAWRRQACQRRPHPDLLVERWDRPSGSKTADNTCKHQGGSAPQGRDKGALKR